MSIDSRGSKHMVEKSEIEMKPKLEDVLFLNDGNADIIEPSKVIITSVCKNCQCIDKCTEKALPEKQSSHDKVEKMIIDHLKGQYFRGYIKYFNYNSTEFLDKSMKNAQKSIKARIKANKLFIKSGHNAQIHEEIWIQYCKSIAFAPAGSKELVLAYESRSNLLLHFKKYADCVKDIDRVLSITNFDLLRVKLLCRKMTCFVAMNKNSVEKMDLWETLNNHLDKIDIAFKDDKFLKMIDQAKSDSESQLNKTLGTEENYSLPLTPDFNVSIKFNNGKHILLANQDFVPGEPIIVTKPLVTSANPERGHAYCSHCLSFMWAGIPCDECALCMYCSGECKAEAWEKYHILECKILPHINFDHSIYHDLQGCIRIFAIGLKEFGSISQLKEQILNIKILRDDSVINGKLFESDFLNFYIASLTRISTTTANRIKRDIGNACFLIAYMMQTLDIFGKNVKILTGKELAKDTIFVDLGFVLFKIRSCITENTLFPTQINLKEPKCTQDKHVGNSNRCCLKGMIFDSFRSKFELSCNPNTSICWTDDGKLIYYCVQPVNTMEKLTFGYHEFFKCELEERYNCSCTACIRKWPLMKTLFKQYEQRRTKLDTAEMVLAQKYLKKNNLKADFVEEENCVFTWEEFEELKKDTHNVVKVCGQPSFASSLMLSFLCKTYEKFYGTIPLQLHIPADC